MAVLSDDMGGITAYAAAVNRGYTGTKEEFEQLMYSYTEVAERAEAAAGNAHESEENSIEAKDIAVNAKNEAVSARDAAQSARDTSISAKNNSESARDAAISAKNDTLAAKDAVMSAKSSVDETPAHFSDEVPTTISDVNAAGRNQKELAKTHAVDSEAWAVGQREGADVGVSDTTYHNNSKYYAEQSAIAKDASVSAKNAAESAKADAISAKNEAETAKGDVQDIVADINAKSEQIDQNAEDISDLQTAISTKAEVDGNYENLTAGTAEQLASTVFIEDNAPYHFRTSGGSADIGDREYDQIVGGTINWNQLISSSKSATTHRGVTFSGSNGVYTASGTNEGVDASYTPLTPPAIVNHVYFLGIKNATNVYVWQFGWAAEKTNTARIRKVSANNQFGIFVPAGTTVDETFIPQVFDLTAMFGPTIADYIYSIETAHAGDGVAWFRKYFPKNYYEYNAGELISVSGLSAHKMTGFNQWDEEWEQGVVLTTTGENYPSVTQIRSKNYIPCLPSMTYYFSTQTEASGLYANICFYDANKNYISYAGVYSPKSTTNPNYANPFNTPANCRYMRFTISASYGAAYKNDICINLHWDGERDGEYEPYEEHSYSLDSNVELRGLFKLDSNNGLYADGDIYDADGTVTRKFKEVDMGDINYTRGVSSSSGLTYFDHIFNDKLHVNSGDKPQTIVEGFINTSDNGPARQGGSYGVFYSIGKYVTIYADYESVEAFKQAVTGKKILYRLETPTTEQAQPFTNPQIVDDFGTEEYVTNSIVPVGHVTKYTNNLRAKLEMAPNSPDGDGDYIVRQTSGLNEYVSLSSSEVIQNINDAISDNAEDISQLKSELSNTRIDLGISRNLFDKASAENGKYCAGTIGAVYSLSANANYCALVIDAKPNTIYTLNYADFAVKEINNADVIVSSRSQTTFKTTENTVKLGLSVTLSHKDGYMIVEGNALPSNYEPYGENLLFETKGKVYEVGSNKTYTSFTACLKALKDDSSKKTIVVYDGTYDVFEEIGGTDFVSTITSNDNWRDVSVIVPPNTKIIGVGDVVLEFMPEDSEITSTAAGLLSALNVSGNVEIENIKIRAKNCRYCIHDETSSLPQFNNAVHKYKNIEAIKYSGTYGYVQSFACGFQQGMKFDFENCVFKSYDKAFSMHNSSTGGATINIKDSVFISGNTYTIELINLSNVQTRNIVNIANCYIYRNGSGKKLAVTGSNVVNTFDVTLIGCTDIGDTTIDTAVNIYPMNQYNAVS